MKNKILTLLLATVLYLSVGLIGCTAEVPEITQYTLTMSSTEGGSVTSPGEPGPYTYDEGEVVNLVANAEEGYEFVNWSGDVDTIADIEDATTTITMNDDYSITANFSAVPTMHEEECVAVFDLSARSYPIQLMVVSLQGIVNRHKAELYTIFTKRNAPTSDWHWIEYYRSRFGMNYVGISHERELLEKYRDQVDGYIVWDPAKPATIDIATTLAGLRNGVIVSPDLVYLVDEIGLPEISDLRKEFENMNRLEIYEWAYESLWPETSRKVIGNTFRHPVFFSIDVGALIGPTTEIYLRFSDEYPRTGFGAALAYTVVKDSSGQIKGIEPHTDDEIACLYSSTGSWVDPDGRRIADFGYSWTYEIACDDQIMAVDLLIQQQYLVEIATAPEGPWMTALQSSETGSGWNGQPWVRDYIIREKAFMMGLSSQSEDHPQEYALKDQFFSELENQARVFGWHYYQSTENDYVMHASSHGLMVLCSGIYPDEVASSLSFHSHIEPTAEFGKTEMDVPDIDYEKVYVTFSVSDGDSLWGLNTRYRGLWNSHQRGEVPIGWQLQPLLLDLAPGMLQYYYESASTNDEFIGSLSGIGYTFPSSIPRDQFQNFLQTSNHYLEQCGLDTLQVLDFSNVSADIISEYFEYIDAVGFFEGYDARNRDKIVAGSQVWAGVQYSIRGHDTGSIVKDIKTIAQEQTDRPLFIPIVVSRTGSEITSYNDLVQIARSLKEEGFEILTPRQFSILLSKSDIT